jgi:hypothetical protein
MHLIKALPELKALLVRTTTAAAKTTPPPTTPPPTTPPPTTPAPSVVTDAELEFGNVVQDANSK